MNVHSADQDVILQCNKRISELLTFMDSRTDPSELIRVYDESSISNISSCTTANHIQTLQLLLNSLILKLLNQAALLKDEFERHVKHSRSLANQAIRHAVEFERSKCNKNIEELQKKIEALRVEHQEELGKQEERYRGQILGLHASVESFQAIHEKWKKDELSVFEAQHQERLSEQRKEYQMKLMEQESSFNEKIIKAKVIHDEELHNWKERANSLLSEEKANLESTIKHLKKTICGLEEEKSAWILEKQSLLEELSKSHRTAKDTHDRLEESFRLELANCYKMQADLKSEISSRDVHYKEAIDAAERAVETKTTELRSKLIEQHQSEISRVIEESKMRTKLLESDLRADQDAKIRKLQFLHEQEIERLLREISQFRGMTTVKASKDEPKDPLSQGDLKTDAADTVEMKSFVKLEQYLLNSSNR